MTLDKETREKRAKQEQEVMAWMQSQKYDRRVISNIAPIIVLYLEWLQSKLGEGESFSIEQVDKLLKMQIEECQYHLGEIFLIEKAWIDPMENRDADGYEPFSFFLKEQDAKDFCELGGYFTDKQCWSIAYKPNKRLDKYRYRKITSIEGREGR